MIGQQAGRSVKSLASATLTGFSFWKTYERPGLTWSNVGEIQAS